MDGLRVIEAEHDDVKLRVMLRDVTWKDISFYSCRQPTTRIWWKDVADTRMC